jgi:SAM-dependent methyltransferase
LEARMATYSLGADAVEVARLEAQAAMIDEPTRQLLQSAGIAPGMRVLDLGTGLGHVAFAVADLVGPDGEVVGVDNEPRMVKLASQRAADRYAQVRFVEADVAAFRDDRVFDAIVARLILFHLPDPDSVLRHHLTALRPGGLMIAIDYDLGAARTEPPVPLFRESVELMLAGFRAVGADPVIGARLGVLLTGLGLVEVRSLGIQTYEAPNASNGPSMVTAVLRSLSPHLVAAGIATPEQLGLDTLAERLNEALRATGAVGLPPTLAAAWGRTISG